MYQNKTAIITGAGSGIGQALSIALADKGVNLILVDISENGLKSTQSSIKNNNSIIETHIVDLGDKEQIHNFSKQILEKYHSIDFLFNIAGIAAEGTFEEISEEAFEKVIRVNFMSQMYLMKAFLPSMKKNYKTYIVNMSSLTGKAAFARQSAYSSSKFAVRGLSNAIAYELEDNNIQISVIYPGAVCTNITNNAIFLDNRDFQPDTSSIKNGIPPQEAVKEILEGIEKGKREIIIGKDARQVLFLEKLFPIKYWDIIKNKVHL